MSAPSAETPVDTCPTGATRRGGPTDAHGYITDKSKYRNRLSRIEGQIRGVDRMIDKERSYIDICTQISAITKALESVALSLLDDHLRHCVLDAAATGQVVSDHKLTEASDAIARLVRS